MEVERYYKEHYYFSDSDDNDVILAESNNNTLDRLDSTWEHCIQLSILQPSCSGLRLSFPWTRTPTRSLTSGLTSNSARHSSALQL